MIPLFYTKAFMCDRHVYIIHLQQWNKAIVCFHLLGFFDYFCLESLCLLCQPGKYLLICQESAHLAYCMGHDLKEKLGDQVVLQVIQGMQ